MDHRLGLALRGRCDRGTGEASPNGIRYRVSHSPSADIVLESGCPVLGGLLLDDDFRVGWHELLRKERLQLGGVFYLWIEPR